MRESLRGLGRAACALAAVAVAAAAWWALPRVWEGAREHHYFAITEVSVRGNSRVSRQEILEWGGFHLGMSLWRAEPAVIQERLTHHPDVASARVRRDFPRRLTVVVRERVRVAIAVLGDLYYVDRSGNLMDRLGPNDDRDLPLITGLSVADVQRGDSPRLRRAVRLVRLCQREGCGVGVSEVHVDGGRGVTIVPLHEPVAIVLGWGGWRGKLARALRVLREWEGREVRLAALDASYPDQVIVRVREAPARTNEAGGLIAQSAARRSA